VPHALIPHPDSDDTPISVIQVDVVHDGSALRLNYSLRGDIERVMLPERETPARADGLWQHTCFEVFVRGARSTEYWEFNLSPSRQWAAYRFDRYREGMTTEPGAGDPRVQVRSDGSEFRLSAVLELSEIPALQGNDAWRLGLSAVIEDESGGKSWWALTHPSGKPDFHHPDSFILDLPRHPLR
jgi:hypothetical protein